MMIDTQTLVQLVGGAILALLGGLAGILLKKVLDELREVKTQTAPIPGLVVKVDTLGREMGERKEWEKEHVRDYHLPPARGAHGD